MNTRFYLYVKAFSDLGSMMDMIVLSALMLALTHSAVWLSISLAVRTIGGLVSSLSSGTVADRADRRTIMVISDGFRAIIVAALTAFPAPAMILFASFAIGLFGSYFVVSFSASVPEMFGEDKVLETNALISRLSAVSMVAGFLLAGVIAKYLGNRTVLSLDAVSYLLSAAALYKLKWQRKGRRMPSSSEGNGPLRNFVIDLKEVKGYLWLRRTLLVIFTVYLVETFGASSHNLGIPLLAAKLAPQNQTLLYGCIWAVWGIGNIVATLVLPKARWIKQNMFAAYFVSTLCMSAGFITFLSNQSLWVVLPFALLTGVFDAASGTLFSTVMQQSDNHIRGRVFGVSTFLNRIGFGIGFLVAPMLLSRMSMPHMVWVLHGTVMTSIVLAALWIFKERTRARAPKASMSA